MARKEFQKRVFLLILEIVSPTEHVDQIQDTSVYVSWWFDPW